MASGKETREYQSVLQHIGIIGYSLKGNSLAKETMIHKYQENKWIDLTECPDETSLVRLALHRITVDASEYHIFIKMLEGIVGMDLIKKKIEG